MKFFTDRWVATILLLVPISWITTAILSEKLDETKFKNKSYYNIVLYSPYIISFIIIMGTLLSLGTY